LAELLPIVSSPLPLFRSVSILSRHVQGVFVARLEPDCLKKRPLSQREMIAIAKKKRAISAKKISNSIQNADNQIIVKMRHFRRICDQEDCRWEIIENHAHKCQDYSS